MVCSYVGPSWGSVWHSSQQNKHRLILRIEKPIPFGYRMNLRQLRQFVTLAETGNFHRAAEMLHMAQPPLSVSIRKLEEEMGEALFEREGRGLRLNPAGQAVLHACRGVRGTMAALGTALKAVISGYTAA